MQIDLSTLTDRELAALIRAAADEWAHRLPQYAPRRSRRQSAPKTDEPPQYEKDFVLTVKAIAAAGDLVRASERRGVAEIAKKYPDWVRRQGLPTDGGTAAWRNLAYRRKIGRPKEQ